MASCFLDKYFISTVTEYHDENFYSHRQQKYKTFLSKHYAFLACLYLPVFEYKNIIQSSANENACTLGFPPSVTGKCRP